MRLTRVGVPFRADKVMGQRGLLVIGPESWHTIERWDIDTRLTADRYTCEFAWWTAHTGMKAKAIRVLLTGEQYQRIYPPQRIKQLSHLGDAARGRIYVHPANWANQLEGCVAPGLKQINLGVGESRLAIAQIFSALGGWEEGKKLELEVS